MRHLKSKFLLTILAMLADLSGYIENAGPQAFSRKVSRRGSRVQKFVKGMEATERELREMGLTASAVTAKKFQDLVSSSSGHTFGEIRELAKELTTRMVDEMSVSVLMLLEAKESEHYMQPRKGWESVVERFPSTISDIEEARKCFALSRYPAAVFHSLQVVEAGLMELGRFIGVTDPKPGWGPTSHRLKEIVLKKPHERTPFEEENFQFLEQVQGTVEALKNAWRNKVSHAEGKLILMTSDFSPDVAEEILFASRAFMRRLATGLPKAEMAESGEKT